MNSKYLYLPEATTGYKKTLDFQTDCEVKGVFPCPCCDHITLPVPKEEAVAYICPVCFWENDVFTSNDDEPSDANQRISLNEGQKNSKRFGSCSLNMLTHVRKPKPEELPDKYTAN